MAIKTGVTENVRMNVDLLSAAMEKVTRKEVLVGIPEETTERKNLDGSDDEKITNAQIAFIQDQGAPEKNIPQREFMRPGVMNALGAIEKQLVRTLNAALRGDEEGVDQGYTGVGIAAQRGIQNAIREGIPPPLSERTLKERAARGRQGAILELEARGNGEEPGIELATPLMDTSELLQSIKYAIRNRDERK